MAGIIVLGFFTAGVALGAAVDAAVWRTVRPTHGWLAATGVSASARVLSAAGLWRANKRCAELEGGSQLTLAPELGVFSGFTVSPVIAVVRISVIGAQAMWLDANAVIVRFLWRCTRRASSRNLD
jgi:hypothetical protein